MSETLASLALLIADLNGQVRGLQAQNSQLAAEVAEARGAEAAAQTVAQAAVNERDELLAQFQAEHSYRQRH